VSRLASIWESDEERISGDVDVVPSVVRATSASNGSEEEVEIEEAMEDTIEGEEEVEIEEEDDEDDVEEDTTTMETKTKTKKQKKKMLGKPTVLRNWTVLRN